MTEAQAYDAIGWPHAGQRHGFVLPLSGDERLDWIAYTCPKGHYSGVAISVWWRANPFHHVCPGCGKEFEVSE